MTQQLPNTKYQIPIIPDQLIKSFINNDQSAFHQIYEKTFDFIYCLIYKFVQNHPAAEDLTHDIYIKIYEKRHTLIFSRIFADY